MRVEIAKDVLKQLRAKVYWGSICYFNAGYTTPLKNNDYYNTGPDNLSGAEVQKEVKQLERCGVCAIGAAVISGIRLYDGVPGKYFDPDDGADGKAAQRFFTKKQLVEMEQMYK